MPTTDSADLLVLEEFRLLAADTDGAAAAIVRHASRDARDPVPLLTSIDDPRDVAALSSVTDRTPASDAGSRGNSALRALVKTWQPAKRYRVRLTARSRSVTPSSFQLAVTESGANNENVAAPGTAGDDPVMGEPAALLTIGVREDADTGILVLVGHGAGDVTERHRAGWPLPLSRDLGVRIYDNM